MARLALEKQADKVLVINIKKLSSVADYLLVCGADSERQVHAIARNIEDGMRSSKVKPLGVEGAERGRWALLDYADVVVHIFHEPVRAYYDLEGLWAEAPVTEVKDKPKTKATATAKATVKGKAKVKTTAKVKVKTTTKVKVKTTTKVKATAKDKLKDKPKAKPRVKKATKAAGGGQE
jgi:ribosome-associated protein